MATVPRANQQVQANPLRPVFQSSEGASIDAFGGAQARELAQVGQRLDRTSAQLSQTALKTMIEDNEREAKRLDIELTAALRSISFGDGTAENPGYYSTRGEATIASHAPTREAMAKARQKLLDAAPNERVRDIFGFASAKRLEAEYESADKYVTQQRRIANDTVSEARIKEAADMIAADPLNPTRLAEGIATVRGEVLGMGERNGWNPEVTNSKLQEAQTVFISQAVMSAVTTNPEAALKLYEENKARIDGAARPGLEKVLLEQNMDSLAQKIAEEVLSVRDDKGKPLSDEAMLAEVRKRTSGKEEERAVNELKERLSERDKKEDRAYTLQLRAEHRIDRARIERDRREAAVTKGALREAYTFIYSQQDQGGIQEWLRLNPGKFEAVAPKMKELLEADKAAAEGRLFANATDGQTMATLRSLDPADLSAVNPDEVRHKLTRSEFDQFTRLKAGAAAKIEAARTGNQSLYVKGEQALFDFAPKNGKNKIILPDEVMQAAKQEMSAFIAEQAEQGKKLTVDDVNKHAVKLMLTVKSDPEGWFNKSETIAGNVRNMTPEERAIARVPVKRIPPETRLRLEAAITKAGLKATDDLLEQLMAADALGDEARFSKLLGIKP